DDGMLDGSGRGGSSLVSTFYEVNLTDPPTWIFTQTIFIRRNELGFWPNAIGFAWTDGHPIRNQLSVRVNNDPSLTHTYFDLGDDDRNGTTSDDVFIGVQSEGEIRILDLFYSYRDDFVASTFEIDHIQYGIQVPEPAHTKLALLALVFLAVAAGWR
ncbi:MAG: hypothetical protein AAF497_23870, partial [Planctomycetota bacterium]